MRRTSLRAAVFFSLCSLAVSASAQVHVWNNPDGGSYQNPANWNGGVPQPNELVIFSLPSVFEVNVGGNPTHGPLVFSSSGNAIVSVTISGDTYTTTELTVGASSGTNDISIAGPGFSTGVALVGPYGSLGRLTLFGSMTASHVVLGSFLIRPDPNNPSFDYQSPTGPGVLVIKPESKLTTQILLADDAGAGSEVQFNGGTLTVNGMTRVNSPGKPTFTQIGDGVHEAVLNLQDWENEFLSAYHYFGAEETLTISNQATVNFNSPGGLFQVGDINRDTDGVFNWVSGIVRLSNSEVRVGTTGQLGADVTLSQGKFLQADGNTNIQSSGVLTIAGSSLTTRTLTNDGGTFNFNGGSLYVNDGRLYVGPQGITNPGGITLFGDESHTDVITVANGPLNISAGRVVTIDGGALIAEKIEGDGALAYKRGTLDLVEGDLTFADDETELSLGAGVRLQNGTLTINSAKSLRINGGSLAVARLDNQGTVEFDSGLLEIADDDLTLGATGDINGSPSIVLGESSEIFVRNGTLTVQPSQELNVDGGTITARKLITNSDITVGNGGRIEGGSLSLGGIGGPGTIKAIIDGILKWQRIGRNNLIVDGGTVLVTEEEAPPGEADPILDNAIVGGYDHDSSMTMNSGRVTTPNMRIGVNAPYIDTVTINGGQLTTDNLVANGGARSIFNFNGGKITTKKSDIDGPATFVVGNGVTVAEYLLNSGTHTFAKGLSISTSGRLGGRGTIIAAVVSAGTIGKLDQVDRINITGSLVNTGSILLDISDVDFYDSLNVTGNFTAGGVIAIALVDPEIEVGDVFDIMDFSALINNGYSFDFTAAELPSGMRWDTSLFATLGSLRIAAGLAGDYNEDGHANAADYTVWRNHLASGQPLPNDDSPGVGPDDYTRWKQNFGQPGGSGASTMSSVPEPSFLALLAITAFLFGNMRRL